MACAVTTPMTIVWPSVDLAATSAASVFDTPGRFSTTTGCLSNGANLSATARAMASVPPPGDEPTRMRTLCEGQLGDCAWTAVAASAVKAAQAKAIRLFISVVSVYFLERILGRRLIPVN